MELLRIIKEFMVGFFKVFGTLIFYLALIIILFAIVVWVTMH